MAQRIVAPSSITWTNQNTSATNIAILRARMQPGQIIVKSDILLLITLINNFGGHYHTYEDLVQEATFGNNGDRNRYAETRDTGVARYDPFDPSPFIQVGQSTIDVISASQSRVTSSHTNSVATQVRNLLRHSHVIFDKIAR